MTRAHGLDEQLLRTEPDSAFAAERDVLRLSTLSLPAGCVALEELSEFGAAADAQLLVDALEAVLDGAGREVEAGGDLFAGRTGTGHLGGFAFGLGEDGSCVGG